MTAVGVSAIPGSSRTASQAALGARAESFSPVNLDDCPILHTGYPRGGCVAQLQTDLNAVQGNHLVVDGTFGPVGSQTYYAVIAFQQAHDLQQDAIVGPLTKHVLEAAVAAGPGPAVTAGPGPAPVTSHGPGTTKYTRKAHSFFGDRVCVAGYCAPVGQSMLWYDSTDPAGRNLSRIQLNWADPERPCSTWIDFDAWSTDGGHHYWHIQGDTHTGCRISDGRYSVNDGTDYLPPDAQAVVCGTLYRPGNPQPKFLARTCVNVG